MKVNVWILGVVLSGHMVGVVWAGYSAHPFRYDFTLDSEQSSVSFNINVKQDGVVKDSDSGTVTSSGAVTADLWQTGAWFQDIAQLDLTQMGLSVNESPSVGLSWWDTSYILPVLCTVDVTANNLAVYDAGRTGSSPVDSAGKFVMPHYQYLGEGAMDYDYHIAGGLYSGVGTENLANYNDGVNNFFDVTGQVVRSNGMVRLALDQTIAGTIDMSGYAPGYSLEYEIVANLVTLPESLQTPILGDANFDGVVDVGDLGMLASNFGQMETGWAQGDFNFDGSVDVGDLGILAGNYSRPTSALVPEPVVLVFLTLAGGIGLIRRRK